MKRVLALFLAMVMLTALLPAGVLASSAATGDVISMSYAQLKELGNTIGSAPVEWKWPSNWSIDTAKSASGIRLHGDYSAILAGMYFWDNQPYGYRRTQIRFDINIDEDQAGAYIPTIRTDVLSGITLSVFHIYDGTATYLGDLKTTWNEPIGALNAADFKTGKNTLVFVRRRTNTDNREGYELGFEEVKLVKVAAIPTVSGVNTELSEIMHPGDKKSLTATVTMSDGRAYNFNEKTMNAADGSEGAADTANRLEVVSSAPSIVKVSAVAKGGAGNSAVYNYELEALEKGSADITFTPYINGVACETVTRTVTVSEPLRLDKVTFTPDKTTLNAGRNTTATISLSDQNGNEYVKGYTTVFSSLDAGIATVEKIDDDTCKIVAKEVGEVKIQAVVTPDDTEEEARVGEIAVTVLPKPYLESIAISTSETIENGETVLIDLSMLMSDALSPIEGASYDLSWSNSNPQAVEIDEENLKIKGIGEGETELSVSALNEKDRTITSNLIKITVVKEEPDFVLDGETLIPIQNPDAWKPYDASKPDGMKYINGLKNITLPKFWSVNSAGTTGTFQLRDDPSLLVGAGIVGQWETRQDKGDKIQFDLTVPAHKTGYYVPEVTFTPNGVDVFEFYVYHIADNKANCIGEFKTVGTDTKVFLNAIELKEGVNTLVFAAKSATRPYYNVYFSEIALRRLQEKPVVKEVVTTASAKIPKLNAEENTVSITMSDGTEYTFERYAADPATGYKKSGAQVSSYLEIKSSNTNVFTVTDVKLGDFGNATEYSYKINAVSEGVANLEFVPYIGGVAQEKITKEIEVTEATRLDKVEIAPEISDISKGREVEAKITLFDQYDTEYNKEYTTVFKSLDETRATVEKVDENTCKIKALSEGDVKIQAIVTPADTNEAAKTGEVNVTVLPAPYLTEITISTKKAEVENGQEALIDISMLMVDGLAELDDADYEFVWSNSNPQVLEIDAENFKINALAEGKATISVSTENEKGESITSNELEITITKAKPDFVLNAATAMALQSDDAWTLNDDYAISGVKYINGIGKIVLPEPWVINPEKTTSTFQLRSNEGGILGAGVYGTWDTSNDKRNLIQFEIDVPAKKVGHYIPEFSVYANRAQCFEFSVYHIAEGKATYLGDFTTNQYGTVIPVKLNAVELKEGTNALIFVSRATKNPGYNVYFREIALKKIDEKPTVKDVNTTAPSQIPQLNVVSCTASLVMSEGADYSFATAMPDPSTGYKSDTSDTQNYMEIKSSDSDVFTVTDVKLGGVTKSTEYSYTITAVSEGTANLEFTPYINGVKQETIVKEITITEATRLDTVVLTPQKPSFGVGRDTTITISPADQYGAEYEREYTTVFESLDETRATVEKIDEETCRVVAKGEGNVTIRATVTPTAPRTGEVAKSGEFTLKIEPKPYLKTINASVSRSALKPGETATVRISSLVMNDGLSEFSRDEYTFVWEVDNEAVISLEADHDTALITALSNGTAGIWVSSINEKGKKIEAKFIEISVSADAANPEMTSGLIIDFTKAKTGQSASGNWVTVETPGFTVVSAESASTWQMKTGTDGVSRLSVISGARDVNAVWPLSTARTNMVTIAVDIPETDYYAINFKGGTNSNGAVYAVYLDGETYLGDYDFYGSAPSYQHGQGYLKGFNTVKLTAGEHKISFRNVQVHKNLVQPELSLERLQFIPLGADIAPTVANIETAVPDMVLGEEAVITLKVRMSDGSYYNFGQLGDGAMGVVGGEDPNNTITVTAINDNILVPADKLVKTEFGNSGVIKYSVVANKKGESGIVFTGKVNGIDFSDTIAVNVLDEVLASTELIVEKKLLFIGDEITLSAKSLLANGKELSTASGECVFVSSDPAVAEVVGDKLIAKGVGTAIISVTTTFEGNSCSDELEVKVFSDGIKEIRGTSGGSKYIRLTENPDDTAPMYITGILKDGTEVDLTGGEFTYVSLTPENAEIDADGNIYPKKAGEASFKVSIQTSEGEKVFTVNLTVIDAKTASILYTPEMRDAAVSNAKEYGWAEGRKNTRVTRAKKDFDNIDILYDAVPVQGIPRAYFTAPNEDITKFDCRYCGKSLNDKYGMYEYFKVDPVSNPWKITCPECSRSFPSNDFASLYKLGLNEYGEYDRIKALRAHREMLIEKGLMSEEAINMQEPTEDISKKGGVGAKKLAEWYMYYGYGVKGGYLHNDLYPEVGRESCPVKLLDTESPEIWGTDDGWGYRTGKIHYSESGSWMFDGVHNYISFYMSRVSEQLYESVTLSAEAYLYTGEAKYGYVAAILLDRFADFYPSYDLAPYIHFTEANHGGWKKGKLWGCIAESDRDRCWAEAYDSVFDLYEDEYVLDFLRDKSSKIKMTHAKETPSQIRTNIEDGLLREIIKGASTKENTISGNFGYPHATVAACAVVLDDDYDTQKALDWLIAPGYMRSNPEYGGGLFDYIINNVDHDGNGDEGSQYNQIWLQRLMMVQTYLDAYVDKYGEENVKANLYSNPKFVSMLYAFLPLGMSNYMVTRGDTPPTIPTSGWFAKENAVTAYQNTNNDIFLKYIYNHAYGNIADVNYGFFVKDSEKIQDEIKTVIAENGDYKLPSHMMTGFGFAALREGSINGGYNGITIDADNRRGAYMYFGTNYGHGGHEDALNLGIDAFGHNLMPDFGYPLLADNEPSGTEFTSHAISHNTVRVKEDTGNEYSDNAYEQVRSDRRGESLHFDDSGKVKVMDVDSSDVWEATDIYRRSVVMVEIDDDNAYYLDFFRVVGGDTHEFSLHTQSDEVSDIVGMGEKVSQVDENGKYVGTLAGHDVPYGPDPLYQDLGAYPTMYPKGYTWLYDVDRYDSISEKIEVEWEIDDFAKRLKDPKDIYLRATMLGVSTADTKVAFANGEPPRRSSNDNVPYLRFMILTREGKNLDSMFTTVYEPYRKTRTISNIEEMPLTVKEGFEETGEKSRAVKVTLANGRVDYVFYSTDNSVTYTLTDGDVNIDFRGFVGVYSINRGENVYKYVCDGDIIGENIDKPGSIKGRVVDFTKELAFENYITIAAENEVSDEVIENINGKYVYVDNGGTRNSAYMIEDAERLSNGNIKLHIANRVKENGEIVMDLGSPTFILKLKDSMDLAGGYIYNIAERQNIVIPLAYSDDNSPIFAPVSDGAVSVGSVYRQTVSAEGHNGSSVTITGRSLPRGASFDSETNTFSWKPTMTQLGSNHVSLTAHDEFGRETTVHFEIEVFGSTSGGGGGDMPTDKPKDEPKDEPTVEPDEPKDEPTTDEPVVDIPTEKGFVDLGNHAWATDAINALADAGIIKGTSDVTFAPANNITRADYAILLVRAFELESEETENFADVTDADYFARELAVARNTGIVGGIGDNKYAPRNTITRQDMMVILYRALTKLGIELKPVDGIDVEAFADYADVADYAREAVKALVEAGLVNGKGESLAGSDFTTRAEVAVLLKRILDYIA